MNVRFVEAACSGCGPRKPGRHQRFSTDTRLSPADINTIADTDKAQSACLDTGLPVFDSLNDAANTHDAAFNQNAEVRNHVVTIVVALYWGSSVGLAGGRCKENGPMSHLDTATFAPGAIVAGFL